MEEKIKQLPVKVKEFWARMGKGTKTLLAVILALVIIVVAGLLIVQAFRPYTVLFTGLTSEDMSSVLTYLDTNGVTEYRVQGSDTVLVPEGQEASLKAKLLMEGYPSSGFGYSMYLDNVGTLSTESDRKTLYLFDLQNRLSAVVRCFDGVKDASVTISQGEDHRYILSTDDVIEASAAVLVTMQNGQKLTEQQGRAIRNLIGSAVQGLQIDNVKISDTAGNEYSAGGDTASTADASQLKLSLEQQVNESVRDNILEVLIPLFGAKNLSVSVNSTVDVSRVYRDSVTYEEPSWAADGSTGGKGIIGTEVWDNTILRDGGEAAGGVAGTTTNSDISEYVENYQPDGSEQQISSSGEIDYNVDTHRTQTENPAGVITDVMVSISINSTTVGTVNVDSLISHVARAAGISSDMEDEKISILPFPFYEEPAPGNPITEVTGIPSWVIYAVAAGVGVLLPLLIIILLLRRRIKKRAAVGRPDYEIEEPVPVPVPRGADIMDLHSERSMELRKDVRQFAEENPELAAQMVKSWLRGGDDHG